MSTLLVGADGSPGADLAVEVAILMARARGANIVFVHANPDTAERLFAADPVHPDPEPEVAAADEVLGRALERATEQGISAEIELLGEHGAREVASAIVGLAMSREADMIVLGTRGHGAMAQTVLGSVSHEVCETSPVPVVVAHRPADRVTG